MARRRFPVALSLAACLIGTAHGRAQSQQATADSAALLRAPQINATTLALLYDKLSGQDPDFRELARHSPEYARASAFQQAAVVDRVAASYKASFERLSSATVYTLTLNANLLQYDADHGGWPTDFTADKYIPFNDPQGGSLQLSFDNADAFNVLPAPASGAEQFAERHGIYTHGAFAGGVMIKLAFRVIAAPPALDTTSLPVTAHIVDAEMIQQFRGTLHVFPPAPDTSAPPRLPAATINGSPALPDATLDGVALGMKEDAAIAAVRAKFPAAAMTRADSTVLFVDGAQPGAGAICGRPPRFPSGNGFIPDDQPGTYAACVEFDVLNGEVSFVRSNQFLPAGKLDPIDKALRTKYGRPSQVAQTETGHMDTWVGSSPGGHPTRIDATLQQSGPFIALRLRLQAWADPRVPHNAAAPETAPKL